MSKRLTPKTNLWLAIVFFALRAVSGQAATIGAGSDITATTLDTAGEARLNIEKQYSAVLPNGTHYVSDFVFKASPDSGGGFIRPFLVRQTSTSPLTYETVWVGQRVAVTVDGIGTVTFARGDETLTLSQSTEVFGGVYHDGTARVYCDVSDGVTDHDNSPTEPTAAGQSVADFSHANLVRTYAFEINVLVPYASQPDPPDGATGVAGPLLSWKAGDTAMWHDVYLGTNPAPGVAEYKGRQPLAWSMWFEAGGWISDETYYWRIDEVEADGTTIHVGNVWSFTAAPFTAYNPDPPDGAKYVLADTDLSWTPGATAVTHDVYLGTDEAEVTNGTGGTFKASQFDPIYDPGILAKGTTYYWRIDEVEQNKTTKHPGTVWSFETIPDIPITDPDLLGWWKLDEGVGTIVVDWSGHDNHGTIINSDGGLGADGSVWDTDVEHDTVASFNGDDSTGTYISAGQIPAMTLTNGFTWTFWAKQDGDGTGVNQTMLGNRYGGTASPLQFIKFTPTKFEYYNDDPNYLMSIDYDDLPDGVWLHHAGVKDGTTLTYYRNGVLAGTATITKTIDENPFLMGGEITGERWRGWLSNVRIYARALTQQEVKQTMRGDPLVAWNPSPANGSVPDIDEATPLTWSPGDNAAKHDVYFGTDEDAVEDADTTTTGIYRGRQDPNTYTPAKGVEFGQSYYWRIDEYNNDATISESKVWSFTVAGYLLVDDFEPYDDYCNRIFYTWPDGWGHNGDAACGVPPYGGNGTGSTVGYLVEPYAEQTIVHEGDQSMPVEYLNDGSTGKVLYSETERTFDPPQDWTRHGVKALTLWFQGRLPSVGSFSYDPATGIYTLTANGSDIFGTADEFHFAYKQLSGVGTIEAQVLSITETDTWSKGGLMIRETLDPNSPFAAVYITGSQGCRFQARLGRGDGAVSDSSVTQLAHIRAPHWIKLERAAGGAFNAYDSNDPAVEGWHPLAWNTQTITMAPNVYIGLALTSHNTDPTVVCTAELSHVAMTGSVTGQWQSQDIGIASNDTERLYVAVEDSTGTVKDVPHPNHNAVQLDTWQEWNIDLAAFAPVDLTKVKKMYIGVGNRSLPTLGGGGMLYIDDIKLYAPRCMPSKAKSAADFNSNCVVDYPDLKILTSDWLFAPGASGLNYEYYEGDWDLLPDFDSLTTALVGKVDNFDISVRTQDDYFGFRFTGQIDIAAAGDYTFYTESDDGSRLYIDGTLVVENDGLHGMVEQSGTIGLTAGMHPITVTVFEKGGGQGLNVQYEGPGITKGPIPDDVLYRQSSLVDLSGDGAVDLKDYALLADTFLDEKLWP